jgi:hypothetical protein
VTEGQSHRASLASYLPLAVLVLGDGLLLAPPGSLLRVAGAMILFLLPGLAWARRLFPDFEDLTRYTVGAGLSYALAMVLALVLHYLPGPIPFWAELAILNLLVLIPEFATGIRRTEASTSELHTARWSLADNRWLLIILLLAAIFRFANLGYSEFQGDEALAMITAAEALEGHQDALFLRGKGPGEVLLPTVLWRLTGTTNEAVARLPFAVAGVMMVLTTYLLGRQLFPTHIGPIPHQPAQAAWPAGAGRGSGRGGDSSATPWPTQPTTIGLRREPGQLSEHAALNAAGLMALNGFMVGFSRIVQYQTLVVWLSGLALLCAWEWRAHRGHRASRWAGLSGAFLGAGLLAHYDAILVAPALAYILVSNIGYQASKRQSVRQASQVLNPSADRPISKIRSLTSELLMATGCLLVIAGLFYLPYALDPQATRTGEYLGDRIGDTFLKNNLDSFLHFNVFYNSSYYVIFTGLLVMAFLAWALRRAPGVRLIPGGHYWAPALATIGILGLVLRPDLLRINNLDLAALPFVLILLGAYLSPILNSGQRAIVTWLAVPFVGYNFAVALPLTHIYTTVPAWTLLAGLTGARLWNWIQSQVANRRPISHTNTQPARQRGQRLGYYVLLPAICYLLPVLLFGNYLYTAYLRHDIEFWQDWPDSQPTLYWFPYGNLPPAGFFGFAHRTGWKETGTLYAQDALKGDYGSNEEPEVTTWYTRGAPRACDPQPEYYLIADDLVDPWPLDTDIIQANYTIIGRASLPNHKGLTVYQAQPVTSNLAQLPNDALTRAFDGSAVPAAFARSARGSHPIDANLGGLIRLIGYDINARRAWPGGRVSVTLYWQAQAPISEDYHVFVHIEGDEKTGSKPGIWGQADGRPVCWTYPTYDWRPGQIIADQHAITVNPGTSPGDYPVLIGMYHPDTGARLDVLDVKGQPIANFVKLTTVPIR